MIAIHRMYDEHGHLCPIDGSMIERNKLIYFAGYLKPIYDENSDIEGGVAAKEMGPIIAWWISGKYFLGIFDEE